jgi:serine/threonine protein kinase
MLSQVCRALSLPHDRGVIHHELEPDDVMIGHFGQVSLLDWGIA